MIKSATIYRFASGSLPDLTGMECCTRVMSFQPCSGTQDKSIGWVPARGEDHGVFVELIGGQRILKLMIESKSVPSAQVKQKAQEAADKIEADFGRKPGKKEMKELREDALQALLPGTFPRQSVVWIWIDPATSTLVIGSTSQRQVDGAVTMLVKTFEHLALHLVQTKLTPLTAMTQWLATTEPESDWPEGFSVERECELKSGDESRACVRFKNYHLLTDEVRKHITEGKLPTRLALSWEGRVPVQLQFNQAGAWRGAVTFDMKDVPGELLMAADTLARLSGSSVRLVACTQIGTGQHVPTRAVVGTWSREKGWK